MSSYNKSLISEIGAKLEGLEKVLACRILGEPFNFSQIAEKLSAGMNNRLGLDKGRKNNSLGIIAEAQAQYRRTGRYNVLSLADAVGISANLLSKMARSHSEFGVADVFDMYFDAYGRWVELELSRDVEAQLASGLSSSEIAIQQAARRRDAGLNVRAQSSDGKEEFEAELTAAIEGKIIDYPIKPPIVDMQRHMPYHEPGDYIIIGARTGMGKTYLALNYIYQAALQNIPTCYINLENAPKNMQRRIWQIHGKNPFKRDMSMLSDIEAAAALRAWDEVKKMPFKTHHTGRSLHNITNAIRVDYYERGIQLAVIDYVQLMTDAQNKGNRVTEIEAISGAVRELSLDLNIPIIALAQIGRESEKTHGKRPTLADLKGPGALEQDATGVLLPFRPAY